MPGFPLPIELTLLIFRCAVQIPETFSTSFDSFFASAQYDLISRSTHAKEARATNIVLLRVCKQWHALAKEILFEQILVRKRWQIKTVLEVLQRTPLHIRSRTRRLDFELKRKGNRNKMIPSLMNIFSLLPNLEILRIDGQCLTSTKHDLAAYLALHLPYLKLLRCYIESRELMVSSDHITNHYLALRGLKSFSGNWSTRSSVFQPPPLQSMTLTTLLLKFERRTSVPLGLRMPALRRFGALDISPSITNLFAFLDIHGPQLISLCLDFFINELSEFEKGILDRCPSIQELVRLDARYMGKLTNSYPSVIHFGLPYAPQEANLHVFERGYINHHYHLDRFPNLTLVRLLDADYGALPVYYPKEIAENLLYPRGLIRFEDGYGCLIPEPSGRVSEAEVE